MRNVQEDLLQLCNAKECHVVVTQAKLLRLLQHSSAFASAQRPFSSATATTAAALHHAMRRRGRVLHFTALAVVTLSYSLQCASTCRQQLSIARCTSKPLMICYEVAVNGSRDC
uniref:Secreted protein n=1 Tax=Echinococcus granulosus TaxID=6210 RepID=U6FTH9_ECHGR|nr:hypothetical protein EgrG_002070600 [Echinococcus granulosus]